MVYGFFGNDAENLENFTKTKPTFEDLSRELFNKPKVSSHDVLATQSYKASIVIHFTLNDFSGAVDSAQVKRWQIPK